MKKTLNILFILFTSFILTACGSKNIEGNLTDTMDKLYEGIAEEDLPMMLETHELTDETFESFAFTSDVDYTEAVYSESMTGSTAHSVVLIRLKDATDASEVVKEIKENANPRKWVCVEAENVYVLDKGDLVVLIMSDERADTIKENFENLK